MRKKLILPLLGALSALNAQEGFKVVEDVEFHTHLKPRYEHVTVDPSTKTDANAFATRATIGVSSKLLSVEGLSFKLDGTAVRALGEAQFNSLDNGKTTYETVVDPDAERISQAILEYKLGKTTLSAGRHIVNLDDQRMIGSVDWRLMMQNLDAVMLRDSTLEGLDLTLGYVWNIKNIRSIDTATDSIIAHAHYTFNEKLGVTLYDYVLASTHDTFGAVIGGKTTLGEVGVTYHAEVAKQMDASRDAPEGVADKKADAYYTQANVGAVMHGIILGTSYELLSGSNGTDGKTAFTTPLATLHKFNGWADLFLGTPIGGLAETTVSLGYAKKGLGKIVGIYHNYTTDVAMGGKEDLGSEIDLIYTNEIKAVKGLNLLLKYANFQGGDVAGYTQNVTKAWVELDYKLNF